MKVRYINAQDRSDPMNEAVIADAGKLAELLNERRNDVAFMADLTGDNGFELLIGIAGGIGCAQFSRVDGEPPYFMAVSPDPPMRGGCVEFLAGGTPTPVAARYIINFDELQKIACYFLETGQRSDAVFWREFDPGAAMEDAGRSNRL